MGDRHRPRDLRAVLVRHGAPRIPGMDGDDIEAAADLFDVEPVALLVPLDTCAQCNDQPPAGFICAACGVEAPRKA
ncbi:hypothetical protein LUR56_21630 [Streptomyces sp. MT29]|nr:hypothetical protein [Streptomyces sp. MT29]